MPEEGHNRRAALLPVLVHLLLLRGDRKPRATSIFARSLISLVPPKYRPGGAKVGDH